jgi:hypothetical protein
MASYNGELLSKANVCVAEIADSPNLKGCPNTFVYIVNVSLLCVGTNWNRFPKLKSLGADLLLFLKSSVPQKCLIIFLLFRKLGGQIKPNAGQIRHAVGEPCHTSLRYYDIIISYQFNALSVSSDKT